jgi:hypothetical protein
MGKKMKPVAILPVAAALAALVTPLLALVPQLPLLNSPIDRTF